MQYKIFVIKERDYGFRKKAATILWKCKTRCKRTLRKSKQHPLTHIIIIILVIIILASLVTIPHYQVSGINNITERATQENQSSATLAQLIGGLTAGIGLLYGIFMTVENLKIANQSKITKNFNRAADQLGTIDQSGHPPIEIKLGGIYALEEFQKNQMNFTGPL